VSTESATDPLITLPLGELAVVRKSNPSGTWGWFCRIEGGDCDGSKCCGLESRDAAVFEVVGHMFREHAAVISDAPEAVECPHEPT
jgi:hypothetical protein